MPGRKLFYAVLVVIVLAVAGISVFLCVSGQEDDDNDDRNVRGNDAPINNEDESEPQSMLITYEAGDMLSPDCHDFLLQRASSGVARRRLSTVDDAAEAALTALESILTSFNVIRPEVQKPLGSVTLSPSLQQEAEQAAMDLLSDMQTPSELGGNQAALVRTAVALSVWAALTDKVAALQREEGVTQQRELSTQRVSFAAFDEDEILISNKGETKGRRLQEDSTETIAASRWLKKVDIEVLRLAESSAIQLKDALVIVQSVPCVASAELDALVPITDPPSPSTVNVRGDVVMTRRLFSFDDLYNSAKNVVKSTGEWITGNFPDETEAAKKMAKSAKEKLDSGWDAASDKAKTGWDVVADKAKTGWDAAADRAKSGWDSLTQTLEPQFKKAWDAVTDIGERANGELGKVIARAKSQMDPGSDAAVALDTLNSNLATTINEWEGAMAKALNEAQEQQKELKETSENDELIVEGILKDAAESMADLLIDSERQVAAIARTTAKSSQRNTRGAALVPEDSEDFAQSQSATDAELPTVTDDEGSEDLGDSNVIISGTRRRRLGDQQDDSILLARVLGVSSKAALEAKALLNGSTSGPRAAVANVKRTLPSPNDALYTQQWSLGVVDVMTAYDLATAVKAKGTETLAILDTGCDVGHEDLKNRMWVNVGEICDDGIDNDKNGYVDDCYGFNFYNKNADLVETKVHGTGVGGAALAEVGNKVGVASACDRCELMCLRVGTTGFSTAAFAEAINYVLMTGVRVVNYSGNGGRSNNQEQALLKAAEADVVIVVSSGNAACNLDSTDGCVDQGYPALLPNDNIIAVGASASSNASASYSSYGTKSVDVYAPAGDILPQPGNTYKNISGTSFSSPLVAGLAALIRATFPQLTAQQVKQAITTTCYPHDKLNDKAVCKGIVDFAAAITAAAKLANVTL